MRLVKNNAKIPLGTAHFLDSIVSISWGFVSDACWGRDQDLGKTSVAQAILVSTKVTDPEEEK